jgi:hypothetical protein
MKRRDFLKVSAGLVGTGLGATAALSPLAPATAQSKAIFKAARRGDREPRQETRSRH